MTRPQDRYESYARSIRILGAAVKPRTHSFWHLPGGVVERNFDQLVTDDRMSNLNSRLSRVRAWV